MTDLEIANKTKILDISLIAQKLGIENNFYKYGNEIAKIDYDKIKNNHQGKVVLVTATSPTPFGEGKTTVSIGLVDALCKKGVKAIGSLREPSLGPVFGIKGGATGGGYSQVIPMEKINLHFTGDFHAIAAANNLICAAIDNHIYQGNSLKIDVKKVVFNRCLDVNDRALKKVLLVNNDYEREEKFDITAASEIMAIFCLAKDLKDLEKMLDNILIAYDVNGKPIFVKDLKITGSLLVLLKDAMMPNLVQTLENNPVLVHGGPFANIAHGCSSIISANLARNLADYVVTEAGFGSDLGALKFFDIMSRKSKIKPDVVVLITTIKALKYNGNNKLESGLVNLEAHLNILNKLTKNVIVCLNKFSDDKIEEIELLKKYCDDKNIVFSVSTAFKDGSIGALDLADKVLALKEENKVLELYDINESLEAKIKKVVGDVYGASKINYSEKALIKIKEIEDNKLDKKPICIAKTQYSISDNAKLLGNPKNYNVEVKDIKLYNGAGFITVYLGNIITMPGLPKVPNYEHIKMKNGKVVGLS